MRPLQARFVTLCQQTLALGVVLAVLTPASGVVSLDIIGGSPASGLTHPAAAAGTPASLMSATVPTTAVEPEVTEVSLDERTAPGSERVVSAPEQVSGFAAVGVTWNPADQVDEEQITVTVRTRTGDTWSDWQELEYHDEHGPDPDSPEAATARPGTEPMFVGHVDDVQVQARTDGTPLPEDLSVALIEPGQSAATETEAPAATLGEETAGETGGTGEEMVPVEGEDALALQASTVAQPQIFTRAQWGADERIRDKSSLRYGTIKAAFVHHTVNANDYTEAEVPGIIRSIYAYHVRSRGWSDIGYNFLVDRFGRIWEGRFGGIDRPVVGAHTLGYNDVAFAMSAIGNFDVASAPDVMLKAYGALFAWKLGLHGVDPMSTSQWLNGKKFNAINGHRDAGSTACPGRYLYAKLPTIRDYAKRAGSGSTPPPPPPPSGTTISQPRPQTNLVGSPHPDLVLRRASDDKAVIIPTGGLTSFGDRRNIGSSDWSTSKEVFPSPDLTGDGIPDLVVQDKAGNARIRKGKRSGRFGMPVKKIRVKGFSLLAAAGDLTGDRRNDMVGRRKGRIVVLRAAGTGFKRRGVISGAKDHVQLIGAGDVTGDGRADLLARTTTRLDLYPGLGNGTFAARQSVPGNWAAYNRVTAGGDYTRDGRPDLVARTTTGSIHVIPLTGNATWGSPIGPVGNFRSMKFLSGIGQFVGGPGPDLLGIRRDKLMVLGNRDTYDLGAPIEAGPSFSGMNLLLNAGDVNRDGQGDVVTRNGKGYLFLYRGRGNGKLRARLRIATGFGGVSELRAVGDVTGDGLPDLTGVSNGVPMVWPGNGSGFGAGAAISTRIVARAGLPSDMSPYDWVLTVSDMQLKSGPDYVVRERSTGRLVYFNGRSSGSSSPRVLGEGAGGYDLAG